MEKCVNCEKMIEEHICEQCKADKDTLSLIVDIKDKLVNKKLNYNNYEIIIEEILKDKESPLKELYKIISILDQYYNVPKEYIENFENQYKMFMENNLLKEKEKLILTCAYLDFSMKTHDYFKAEKIYNDLKKEDITNNNILYNMIEYCIRTRNYEQAKQYIDKAIKSCNSIQYLNKLTKKLEECNKRVIGEKKQYIPVDLKNKAKYIEFLENKGINLNTYNLKIEKEEVKTSIVIEHTKMDFNTFVAFDLETTGFANYDEITEIGAIRVENGKIIETKKFVFQELVNPKRKVSSKITEVTGITNDMLYNARTINSVFKDFKKFIGDDILLGYNCISFDSRFITKAAKSCNIEINNKYFDVLKYVRTIKGQLGISKTTLGVVSEYLGIENPCAHRALADAITTAKVYLELKKI